MRFVLRSKFLKEHLAPPGSYLSMVVAAAGMTSFALLVLCNLQRLNDILDINHLDLVQYPLRVFGYFFGSAMGQNGSTGYGALTLLVWALTIVALSLGRGVSGALKSFAIPSILFLTVVVLLFDPGQMDIQAVNIVSGITYDGISLLSNWFLFTVSLLLTVFEVAYDGVWKRGFVRLRLNQPGRRIGMNSRD